MFGINISNHQAAAKTAKQSQAIKALAQAPLADLLARLDNGLDVNAGVCCMSLVLATGHGRSIAFVDGCCLSLAVFVAHELRTA